ncbi:MAG: DUF302 domain-containing protein [Bacilli bacterium]
MDFHYSVVTDKTIDAAIQSLEETLKANKFGLLWQMNIPEKLQEKGVEFDMPFRVLEVCNPNEAKRVLTQNPMVGYFLPCKIVVYELAGKTHIGMPKPSVLMNIIDDPTLVTLAQNIEDSLKKSIDDAR